MKHAVLAFALTALCTSAALAGETTAALHVNSVDCRTGDALPFAHLVLKSATTTRAIATDAQGRYATVGLEPGTYRISFASDPAESASVRITADGGDAATVQLGTFGRPGVICASARIDAPTVDRYVIR